MIGPVIFPRNHLGPAKARVPFERAIKTSVLENQTTFVRQGLVLALGASFAWDNHQVGASSVLLDGGDYKMWYYGCAFGPGCNLGYATSWNGRSWTKQGVVLAPNLPPEGQQVEHPDVLKIGSEYWMWYNGWDVSTWTILAAVSADGTNWTKRGVVLGPGPAGSNDAFAVLVPHVLYDGRTFWMYYTGRPFDSYQGDQILLATSSDGLSWTGVGLVLGVGSIGANDGVSVQAGNLARSGSSFEMVYRGMDANGTWRLLDAVSPDGIRWQRLRTVLEPLGLSETVVSLPYLVPLANGALNLYYTARAGSSDLQVYLATAAPTGTAAPPGTTAGGSSFGALLVVLLLIGGVASTSLILLLVSQDWRMRHG